MLLREKLSAIDMLSVALDGDALTGETTRRTAEDALGAVF